MNKAITRTRLHIEGIVQGVGFRPFVYREAQACGLAGWVLNNSQGVLIEIEGLPAQQQEFLARLQQRLPPLASITRLVRQPIPAQGESSFQIRASATENDHNIQVAADSYVCPDCLAELFDPADRRYGYPFINCTNCGPRYSIVTAIPYDRPNTTMAAFRMCPHCQAEYDDPGSRRFHAQPNACPVCGPQLQLVDAAGNPVNGDPIAQTSALLAAGHIIAIKGLGGYHLAVAADNAAAVAELRRRKARDEKPFALMSFDLERIRGYARVSAAEAALLTGPQRPIVLLEKLPEHNLAELVAPRNRYFGVMLPATPLHYLLLRQFPALVMTSGNRSDEPIAFEDHDARERLATIADYRLSHNRAIHIRCDDSIARVMTGKPLLLRRSRGFVPHSLPLPGAQSRVLALGAELKSTFCLSRRDRAFLSQHIGDLKNLETAQSLAAGIAHLERILEWQPEVIAHDLHPDYLSTSYARERAAQHNGLPCIAVQHHHAHLASCMAENGISEPCIGLVCDGIGYGEDGQIWGGEFLIGDYHSYQRVGHFADLPMPGGDAATREPYRMAISLLHRVYGRELPELPFLRSVPDGTLQLLLQMIEKRVNSPLTSSCGRLFDAIAALTGLRSHSHYEGQAALELEMAISGNCFTPYPYQLEPQAGQWIFDPGPSVRAIVNDLFEEVDVGMISGRFHTTLAVMMVDVCSHIRAAHGLCKVVLSGGVFQNRFLTETILSLLHKQDFQPVTHSLVPPNDGGLALGQAVIAGHQLQ
ncbi:carbamoyltransferase HypF [Pelobacter seleniigenes]|uniref:carbamoyltransferase HypF n=1 Tax=Pelobacter seleniigenes TaxID=407188 RepID=UPI000ACF2FF9|nr:carbamoyltransferase HypF [Pelobacter seleniigenes]